ncbi:hypothetical protein [Kitasatospora sp. GP82]|uniref:hypothetical protein n=1 Tax=Kitasatospora sp. GP82 TaxID=3035089 RepID=UPI002476C074|nr:hypothetical protein [Kitasatospora sp. GP82]MDH6128097.1 hypothetical protein [Kitasatospora sp. GP82]
MTLDLAIAAILNQANASTAKPIRTTTEHAEVDVPGARAVVADQGVGSAGVAMADDEFANLANDRWRRLGRSGEHPDRPGIADRADPHDAYRSIELRDELVRALHSLPMGMRTVVVLHYLHDRPSPRPVCSTRGCSLNR